MSHLKLLNLQSLAGLVFIPCFSCLQEVQVTLSLTNPVENLLKVTLLKLEQEEKEAATENVGQEKNNPDQSSDKIDDKKVNEENKGDADKNKEVGEKDKEEKKGEQEGKEKDVEEKEKSVEEKKKENSVGVTVSKKPDRSMDNSCESRCFVPTAEVNLTTTTTFNNNNNSNTIYWFTYLLCGSLI